MSIKKHLKTATWVLLGIAVLFLGLASTMLLETVEKGTYQVKQAAITGNMTAKMSPGMWWQLFGDIEPWPAATTYFFTYDKDVKDDVNDDTSIEVRFNDGSLCNISGTLRIIMPAIELDAVNLVLKRGHRTYKDVQAKLIQPHVRNVLRTTANLMSARESYSTKRIQFVTWARDQIQNGVYETTSKTKPVKDLVSGETIMKRVQVIKEVDGKKIYQANPLAGTTIIVKNFEVKKFRYEEKVRKQISKQQEALMAVATAKAKAAEAEQDKLTIVAQGKAKVAQAKYEEEQKKVRAVVVAKKNKEVQELDAERDKRVATIAGEKRKKVVELDKDAASFKKQEQILLGEGEAKRKALVLAADGALKQKLETFESVMSIWANAYANRKVPTVMMGGGSDLDHNALDMEDSIALLVLDKIGLDMSMSKGKVVQE